MNLFIFIAISRVMCVCVKSKTFQSVFKFNRAFQFCKYAGHTHAPKANQNITSKLCIYEY